MGNHAQCCVWSIEDVWVCMQKHARNSCCRKENSSLRMSSKLDPKFLSVSARSLVLELHTKVSTYR